MLGRNLLLRRSFSSKANPFQKCYKALGTTGHYYYDLKELGDSRLERLPLSIRVLLESAVRNCDEFEVKTSDVENILNWSKTSKSQTEIPFKPARVILQDFTGVPAVVDFAAMRDAMARLGGDSAKINPLVPVDLVIDHSVMADYSRNPQALERNQELEFQRNRERFGFLKWGASAFNNLKIVPPGSGIVHQVNLEYLARVVMGSDEKSGALLYPDSLVGTDSHTTMIDGLGVAGWGVGGIEAEAVMLGQAISMVLPEVVGFRLTGRLPAGATATDLVLTCTNMLRKRGVVGKFVEFFGPGCANLSLADRATIANMAPEYGGTMGFFGVDQKSLDYLLQTGRSRETVANVEAYLRAQGMFQLYGATEPEYSGDVMELDLATIEPCVSGPKRPHDRVAVSELPRDFAVGLSTPSTSFKGFNVDKAEQGRAKKFSYKGKDYSLEHGSVVLAAITSCTNTSNPGVMLGAGLLARNARDKGLKVSPYIKTSLSPGSGVVDAYLRKADLLKPLEDLGFFTAGFGCMTCIGNSGDLDPEVSSAITDADLVVAAVLSGNRNFEGRVHPLTRANYLASPPLVVAYALAGRVTIDFDKEPLGQGTEGPVYLRDIWPTSDEIARIEMECVRPEMFRENYAKVISQNKRWNELHAPTGNQFEWSDDSTYITNPPFFSKTQLAPTPLESIKDAYCLLNLGDSITTDHISPAGKITPDSPGGRYLIDHGVEPKDFNSYGSRRGNYLVMARGTFANIRLVNKLMDGEVGPKTEYVPTGEKMFVYDAAERYIEDGKPLVILAGSEYGSGSSRDWAAKGPSLQGVKAVIAKSYERIHRSNLVGMGILPLQFPEGVDADTLGLDGRERYSIDINGGDLAVGQMLTVHTTSKESPAFEVLVRLDTEVELTYFQHGGILQYVLRKLASSD
ncbi:hypothetical protein FOZ60_015061 [Perkinsus olseni]|uniref:Aconitate hydratase n=1 Tax=Perkinsus olseni TaxID=32597 RepID=A0A7J6N6I9_PEROL|nr:hypothetical protein FOZ60_015061 [Perkinsus olseni]